MWRNGDLVSHEGLGIMVMRVTMVGVGRLQHNDEFGVLWRLHWVVFECGVGVGWLGGGWVQWS